MIEEIKTYNVSGKQFFTKEEAEKYEKSLIENTKSYELDLKFRSIFPRNYYSDDWYNCHCVKCGNLLVQYDSVYDGHRNERGDVKIDNPKVILFGGNYCPDCYNKIWSKVRNILIEFWNWPESKDFNK